MYFRLRFLLCSQYTTHKGRPYLSYKRAILFPPHEAKPRFIWIERKTEEDEDNPSRTWESSLVKEHLGGKLGGYDVFPTRKLIQSNVLRARNRKDSLGVVYCDTFGLDGSEPTKSVITVTHDPAAHMWKGPIVALKLQGLGMDLERYMDIDMHDYRDVVDYFISHGDGFVREREVLGVIEGVKVRGVKINCKGNQRTCDAEAYTAVDVPKGYPIFYEPIAPISKLVGMPIHTRKCPANRLWRELWRDNHSDDSDENEPATKLHSVTHCSSDWWGCAPMQWQNTVGTVLVVRRDGQDVTTQQVEALSHFCQFKMSPLFENAHGAGTRESFREYFAEMRAKKVEEEEDEDWRTASPRILF